MKRCYLATWLTLLISRAVTGTELVTPVLNRDPHASYSFQGQFNDYLEVILQAP
ncbi:MAG: hypothetical protein MK171_13830 [Pirellulales bacterium]|nr:hypothetical protein [Pirellulales bacterium]